MTTRSLLRSTCPRRCLLTVAVFASTLVASTGSCFGLPPAACGRQSHLCSRTTYIAVFGQLSSLDPRFTGRTHNYQHPIGFGVTSLSTRISFHGLRWRDWGGSRATATGTATTCGNNGRPAECPTGKVRLVADRFGPCPDGNLYERLSAYGVPQYPPRLNILVASQDCGVA